MYLSEKKNIEKATAQLFLNLYNNMMSTNYDIQKLGDTPDVICKDTNTGRVLELEITLLQDVQGDVAYVLGRGQKPISPTTKSTVVSFNDDTATQLDTILGKKLLSSYGANAALVIRQVSPLWEPKEWTILAPKFRQKFLKGKQENYGMSVWIICTDNLTWPATYTLFRLSEPR